MQNADVYEGASTMRLWQEAVGVRCDSAKDQIDAGEATAYELRSWLRRAGAAERIEHETGRHNRENFTSTVRHGSMRASD